MQDLGRTQDGKHPRHAFRGGNLVVRNHRWSNKLVLSRSGRYEARGRWYEPTVLNRPSETWPIHRATGVSNQYPQLEVISREVRFGAPRLATPEARAEDATRFGSWLVSRLRDDPLWLVRRALVTIVFLVTATAVALKAYPAIAAFALPLVLIAWGGFVLLDYALRGASINDPRTASVLLVAGVGTLVVALTSALT